VVVDRAPDVPAKELGVRILFLMRHVGYVRNFEWTLRRLLDRGHRVELAFQHGSHNLVLDPSNVAQQLADQYPRFSKAVAPMREDALGFAAQELRLGLDYLRYLEPEYHNAPKLRERARRSVSETWLKRTSTGPFATSTGRAVLARGLRALAGALPTDAGIDAFLEVNQPQVLAVTPLIEPGAPQAEYLRSARRLGIRTALCVASWDNLTNKGLIHGAVDLVTVWNDAMKQEAVSFHGIPPERVAVTGAQPFDHWFDWAPSTTREEFCRRVGLRSDTPYILYLCSSGFIAPQESGFIRNWIAEIRRSPWPALANAGILVRPHPQNVKQWRDDGLSEFRDVVVWPRAGATPADDQRRAEFFDSIYHCGAAVGVNTTAEIESAIVGRGVFTLLAPEFRDTQEGTLHFEHLRRAGGGLVQVAESMTDHLAQLDAALRDPSAGRERCRRFVETFVRPHGINEPAATRVVRALEDLVRSPAPSPRGAPWWSPLAGALLRSRGERLQREAFFERETKAARARRRPKAEPKAESPVEQKVDEVTAGRPAPVEEP
jgi:hypothetical protein